MTRRSPILVYLLLAVATAGMVGVAFVRSRNRVSTEQTAMEERASLATKRRGLDRQLAAVESKQVELRAELDRLAAERATPAATPTRPPLPLSRPLTTEQVASQGRTFKARLAVKYGAFYRAAGFDDAMIRRFEQLLADREALEGDLWTRFRDTPASERTVIESIPRSDGTTVELKMTPVMAEIRRQQIAQFEADQIALLGEAGYRQLLEFERDEGKRFVVSRLVSDLTLTPASLTPAQSAQFAAMLQAIDFGGKPAPSVEVWPEIIARAQGLLSAPQMVALKRQATKAEHLAATAAMTKLIEREGK